MKKICFVTAARSEYGLLKWLMKDISESSEFTLQLVVTGGHLSYEQGHTVEQIIEDGFDISYIVDAELETSSTSRIAESMGKMAQGFAKAFDELHPDYLLVLGDRYELLPICSSALIMRIPIIHLCGGDITEGAIDDSVRNSVTMMADYHFVGTESAAQNIKRMRNSDNRIWIVGEPGLDAFVRNDTMSRAVLAKELDLDINSHWVLMTYHSETKEDLAYNLRILDNIIQVLLTRRDIQTVITYANADFGGSQINEKLEEYAEENKNSIRVISSLGQYRYLSYMRQVEFVIGNSSSGIVEAPFLNIPVINVGNRQLGRYLCGNIIQSDGTIESLVKSINDIQIIKNTQHDDLAYWGDGYCSERIFKILRSELR